MSRHSRSRSLPPSTPRLSGTGTGIPLKTVLDRLYPPNGTRRAAPPSPATMERRVTAEPSARQLSIVPKSWNEQARTIDVVWTTGARGARFSFEVLELVDEELATAPGNVRLDRLNRGAPVLNSHQSGDLRGQIGTVVPGTARMANGQGLATVKLSGAPEHSSIVADIAAGIIRNLSVGYVVHTFEVDRTAKPRPLYRAVDWEPTEISFTPVPFDAGAQVRDLSESPAAPCLIRTVSSQESKRMSTSWLSRFTRGRGAPPVQTGPGLGQPQGQQQGAQEEEITPLSYDRPATIGWLRNYTQMMQEHYNLPENLTGELTLEMAERQMSEGDARDTVMHIMAERQRQQVGRMRFDGSPSASPAGNALVFGDRTFDNPNFHSRAVEDALFARMSGKPPTEQAREFMGMTMVQIAGELLTRSGVQNAHRMSPSDMLSAAAWNSGGGRGSYMNQRDFGAAGVGYHTTSDFPELLLGAGQRFLMDVFAAAASPLKLVSRQRSSRDFRAISGLELSGFGTLPVMAESGEFTHGTFRERKETYRIRTFGKQFALSRQAIINDDLGAFADPMVIMARSAAETEAQLLADLVNNAPVMSDGKPLFHADHGNLAAVGRAPSVEALDEARQAMRRQKALDGTPIAPTPKYIVSGIENETGIEKLMTTLQAGTADSANPFAGKLIPAVDPRLNARAWHLFGDPAIAPTLEHAYLNDKTGPTVEQKDGWNTLGTEFRVFMDFGAGAVDWRGAYKNPGAPA